ncbi:Serine/threonine-protein kinase PknB [Thalassoglobus neptunius]|uniref:Serine/threonine-protein kinase PknB n=1 Tax=Thalassoglobus neptunius TaxID=1938619 RepID=A0A5C5VAL4_9PLAN|nr:serine/threonine-protein kinase [Thalassoglobus neptunius]TWT34977.1 Serine/threonine-protein kinase PknB [Thalassoglobus neptunius]
MPDGMQHSIEEIFGQAIELSPEEREKYLSQFDDSLRAELDALFSSNAAIGRFLDGDRVNTLVHAEDTSFVGTTIGPYKIREQIGEGGFGVVYVAEQAEPIQRKVALKIIKPGMDSKDVIARFEAERQALALMDHPNVARVLDAGTTDAGHPYFVMELVKGIPITEFCNSQKLTTRKRLSLFLDVCRAIQHAHQKGIIHRDIKPTNILVTLRDGKPVPKVIDFGVAKALSQKLTARTVYTAFGQMIGTPLYMSPEQAELSELDVDTRSDVYSLGVLLYELLTGTTPFDRDEFKKAAFDEIRRMIREQDPIKPSSRLSTLQDDLLVTVADQRQIDTNRLAQTLKGDLDWVIMKSLAKDRERRYESASAFADDLHRHLNSEPVVARPPSFWYLANRYVARNRGRVATVAIASICFIVSAIGTIIFAMQQKQLADDRADFLVEKEQQTRSAEDSFEELKVRNELVNAQLAAALVSEATAIRKSAQLGYRENVDDLLLKALETGTSPVLRNQIREEVLQSLGDPISIPPVKIEPRRSPPVPDFPDSMRHLLPESHRHSNPVPGIFAGSTTGNLFAAGKTITSTTAEDEFVVSLFANDEHVATVPTNVTDVKRLIFSPQSNYLAAQCGEGFVVWSITDMQALLRIGGDNYHYLTFHHNLPILLSVSNTKGVEVWSIKHGRRIASIKQVGVKEAFFLPDGNSICIVRAVNSTDGQSRQTEYEAWSLFQSPERTQITGFLRGISGFDWGPDGEFLVAIADDGMLRKSDPKTGRHFFEIPIPKSSRKTVAVSKDGELIAVGGTVLRLYDKNCELIAEQRAGIFTWCMEFSADSKRLFAGGSGGIKVWDIQDQEGSILLEEASSLKLKNRVSGLAVHPSGKELLCQIWKSMDGGAVGLYRFQLEESEAEFITTARTGYPRYRFVAEGTRFPFLSHENILAIMEWPSQQISNAWSLDQFRSELTGYRTEGKMTVSPDGKLVALFSDINQITIFNLQTGRPLYTLPSEKAQIYYIGFSPTGSSLAVLMSDGGISIWKLNEIDKRMAEFAVDDATSTLAVDSGVGTNALSAAEIAQKITIYSSSWPTNPKHWQILKEILNRHDSLDIRGIEHSGVTTINESELSDIEDLKELAYAIFEESFASDSELVHLSSATNLRYLDLTKTCITDEGLRYLAGLKSLEVLSLAMTQVQGLGLKHLNGLKSLRHLDLRHSFVDVDQALDVLLSIENLEFLDIRGCVVSQESIEELTAQIEDVQTDLLEALNARPDQIADANGKMFDVISYTNAEVHRGEIEKLSNGFRLSPQQSPKRHGVVSFPITWPDEFDLSISAVRSPESSPSGAFRFAFPWKHSEGTTNIVLVLGEGRGSGFAGYDSSAFFDSTTHIQARVLQFEQPTAFVVKVRRNLCSLEVNGYPVFTVPGPPGDAEWNRFGMPAESRGVDVGVWHPMDVHSIQLRPHQTPAEVTPSSSR